MTIKELIDAKNKKSILEAHGGGGGQEIILTVESNFQIPVYTVLRKYN
jgi:anionic cell wall polymer biosynthesis LytR-Cps2A-Psr (LCP) family protein